jgi:hypothetical protein
MAARRWRREAGAGAGRARREGKRRGTREGEKGGGAPGWGGNSGGVALGGAAAWPWRLVGGDGRQGKHEPLRLAQFDRELTWFS